MGTANIASFQALLKDVYEGPVREQLNSEVFLLSRLTATTDNLVGNRVVVPLHSKRSAAVGARGEDVVLPAPDAQGYDDAYFKLAYLYGSVRVTGPSMALSKADNGAFLRILESELDKIRDDLKVDLARQIYGTGDGKIATCGTTTASATVVLGSAEELRKGNIYEGMRIDIGTIAAPTTVVAGATVLSVNIAGPSITIDSSVTTSSSHFVFRQGSNFANGTYEISGLRQIVADAATTFGTIDPTAAGKSYWDNLRDTSTTTLTQDAMMQADAQVAIKGGSTSLRLTTYGIRRTFFNLLQPQIQYVQPTRLAGGFESLEFMGSPLVVDRHCPFKHMYFLDEQHIKVYNTEDWHFLAEDGHPLKQDPTKDAWVAYLARYMNLGVDRRNTSFVFSALTDPNGF